MVRSFAALAAVAVAATTLQVAEAHSNLVFPEPKWPEGFYARNSPVGIVDSTKLPSKFANHEGVKRSSEQIGTGTLRDYVYKNVQMQASGATKECGTTLMDGPAKPIPAEIDFPWGHPGPCEAWCDDTKLFYNADCGGNGVGKIKVDASKCAGAKRLQVMYLGVHVPDFQYYPGCIPLGGSGGGGAAPSPANPNPAPAPRPNPAPAQPNPAPAPRPNPAPQPNPAPAPRPNPAPQPNPAPAPAPSKNNCVRRLRN